MGNLMIYVEMVRPSDVKNILRLVFPLVFKVALLFAEVRSGQYKYRVRLAQIVSEVQPTIPHISVWGANNQYY